MGESTGMNVRIRFHDLHKRSKWRLLLKGGKVQHRRLVIVDIGCVQFKIWSHLQASKRVHLLDVASAYLLKDVAN